MRLIASIIVLSAFARLAAAQDLPWHADGWPHRAIVSVDTPGSAGVDVAAVRIRHAGAAAASADDYRVFDGAGQPVPYQVTFHDPARETLLSFRVPGSGGTYAVYYGNAAATADPLRVVAPPLAQLPAGPPQPGPDANGWMPRAGLVLVTLRRPRPDDPATVDNPETVEQMAAMIAASPGADGAAYRANISDGYNPFGESDYYISVYRGWINLPTAGTWGFCTASNEASFSFINGNELVHWPGRHTEERGRLGQKNAEQELTAGLHYVEYAHEEVLLQQMAFLGCKPPGAAHYGGIPAELFPQPHGASVRRYEASPAKPSPAPTIDPRLLDSVWPRGRGKGQYTRYRFAADAGADVRDLAGWKVAWSFGDGQSAEGAAVEHVYLKPGDYTVTMSAAGPQGQSLERAWPLRVFPVEHLAGGEGFQAGELSAYAPIVQGYDPAKLPAPLLAEYARFQSEAGQRDAAKRAAEAAVARADLPAEDQADMHLLIASASAAGARGLAGAAPDPAAARALAGHLQAALEAERDPVQRMLIRARFIRAVGIDQADVELAEELYAQAQEEVKQVGIDRAMRLAYREATVAMGDAHLYAQQIEKAALDYRTAEALADSPIPPQVQASKSGAYPEAIEQHLAKGELDQALEVARRWQEDLPSDQVRGTVLYYVAKLDLLQGRPAAAVRPLEVAIALAQGAEFEAEARWLLAQAQRELGDAESATRTLQGLVRSGLAGPYREKAIEALRASEGGG